MLRSKAGFEPVFHAGVRPHVEVMCAFIEEHREEHGPERICRTLQIAPSTYDARRPRLPSARSIRGAELTERSREIHWKNYGA